MSYFQGQFHLWKAFTIEVALEFSSILPLKPKKIKIEHLDIFQGQRMDSD